MTGALAVYPIGFDGDVDNTARNLSDSHATLEQEGVLG